MYSVAEKPMDKTKEKGVQSQKIIVVDDQLRRIYLPKNTIRDIQPDELTPSYEVFRLHQRVDGIPTHEILVLGSYRTMTPFDSFGRRIILAGGRPIVQGITEITPGYIRVQGINLNMDMRISPHSIPRKNLTELIKKTIKTDSLDDRLRVYQYYVQAELYEQAVEELQEIITDFQEKNTNEDRLKVGLQMIRQLAAQRLIQELELRQQGGQYRRVRSLLATFESQGISNEKIQTIRRMISKDEENQATKKKIIDQLKIFAGKVTDPKMKDQVDTLFEEIERELNDNTLDRFSEFLLSLKDTAIDDNSRLAIGLSGWLVGNVSADNRLEIALSMYRVRNLARKYLLESIQGQREALWSQIKAEEASTPERVARLLHLMKPPRSTPRSTVKTPLYYEREIPSYEPGKTFRYCVQLPPEYDPNRTYPMIITLHGERTTAKMQLDWWCGPWVERKDNKGNSVFERFGQATRYGYIVLAPEWNSPGLEYDYTARTQAAILYSMRDVLRRFSVDTDRIFLSGHASGGDAVWDLGLAHPDLWAGIIPICGSAKKYPSLLKKNAEFVSVYAVGGELDGGKLLQCQEVLDWGMDLIKPFDMTYVQFKGRGNEAFSDELIRIFEWMQLRTRNFFNKNERTVYTLRPWDNFFWSTELNHFSPDLLIDPSFWTFAVVKNTQMAKTEFFRISGNNLKIKSSAESALIFLSPELLDFQQRVEVLFNTKKISPANGIILPSSAVMLEDARTRCDRKHPFWAVLNSTAPGELNNWYVQ